MKKVLIATLVAVFTLGWGLAYAADWTSVADKLTKAVVPITYDGDGGCTGFVVDTARKFVLTAAHCDVSAGQKIYVDQSPATVVNKDVKRDLMVLKVEDLNDDKVALKLAGDHPRIGEAVASFGFGYALERPMFRTSFVADNEMDIPDLEGGPFIIFDASFVGGQSGGPIVNGAGDVVAIVQRASNNVGIGVGVGTIKSRVGRYFTVPGAK